MTETEMFLGSSSSLYVLKQVQESGCSDEVRKIQHDTSAQLVNCDDQDSNREH